VHRIVVGRDHSGAQHSHLTMPIDGTCMVGMTLPSAGGRRGFAEVAAEASQPGATCQESRIPCPARALGYLVEA
jgi:hypothetical protein